MLRVAHDQSFVLMLTESDLTAGGRCHAYGRRMGKSLLLWFTESFGLDVAFLVSFRYVATMSDDLLLLRHSINSLHSLIHFLNIFYLLIICGRDICL